MNNGCNEILEAKIAERNERAKKVYRYISDIARRIGETTTVCQDISELFATNLEVQRQKLRDNCEKLLFCDPLNYGKKSLELLWRKVYYETVCAAKKLRELNNEFDSFLFTHIMCGLGHFHHIITRIQSEMKVKINELDYMPFDEDNEELEINEKLPEDEIQFVRSTLYSCFIYLGDLSRYQAEIFNRFDPSIATRYYLQAAQIDTSSGMPYNQLGNLYLDKNYNLDSVCYYIHCMSSVIPFEGALGNLTKIFEKNNQFLNTTSDINNLTQAEHIQNSVTDYLSLIEIWYFNKESNKVPELCNTVVQKLKIAMEFSKSPLPQMNNNYNEYLQAVDEEQINPSYLNNSLIYNIVKICLFTNAKIIETDETKAFACKAFTLAFLCQLLQKLLKHLESMGLKSPAFKYNPKIQVTLSLAHKTQDMEEDKTADSVIVNGNKNQEEITEISSKAKESGESTTKLTINGDSKNSKKILTKRRRRRRIASSESSDMSDAETESSEVETDKSISDDEMSDSTYASEDDSKTEGSQYEESDSDPIQLNGHAENDTNKQPDDSNSSVNHEGDISKLNNDQSSLFTSESVNGENKFDATGIQNFLLGDNFLSSIKLLQDWVLMEKDLILSCGESGESLFKCVVDLLNIFIFYFHPKKQDKLPEGECQILSYAKCVANKLKLEYKTIPLPEDLNLRGTNICKFDKDAAEWQILEKFKPSVYEENVIRILNFIDFGYQIAKIVPRIRFNRSLKIFYFKKIILPKIGAKINHKRTREWHNSKKQIESREGGLLRRLGRLWLTSQVKELELNEQTPVPSLLALDTAALYKHLKRVKQLLRTRNFVFLVPTVVLQELDNLKRERSTARDAIRWLEIQLKSGSRFLRTQRPGQSKPLPFLKYPRKAPPNVHNFIQILEFCNHFIADEKHSQGGNGDPDNSVHGKTAPLLMLLIGNEHGQNEENYKEFSLTGAANSAGISVEYIGDFYTKWRQTVHKNGKKR